jgi:hypothetical protein
MKMACFENYEDFKDIIYVPLMIKKLRSTIEVEVISGQ